MATRRESVRLSENGRILIPASIRKELGLVTGEELLLTVDGSDLRISTRAAGIRRAQEMLEKYVAGKPSMADELIAERRAEAARE